MPRAEIYIEDSESQPGADVRFVFPDGFVRESPAHQLANIIRMKLDEMVTAGELTPLSEREEHGDTSAANDDLAQRAEEVVKKDE